MIENIDLSDFYKYTIEQFTSEFAKKHFNFVNNFLNYLKNKNIIESYNKDTYIMVIEYDKDRQKILREKFDDYLKIYHGIQDNGHPMNLSIVMFGDSISTFTRAYRIFYISPLTVYGFAIMYGIPKNAISDNGGIVFKLISFKKQPTVENESIRYIPHINTQFLKQICDLNKLDIKGLNIDEHFKF